MKHRNLILGLVAGAAVSMASAVQAAPFLSMGLTVLDTSNVAIAPTAANTWTLAPGSAFRLQVTATITSPKSTDAGHTNGDGDPIGSIQLGIQNLTFNIVSSGPGGSLNPLDTGSGKWALTGATGASRQALPSSVNFTSTNLVDQGADGDMDPSGAGYSNNALSYDGSDTPSALGLANGLVTLNVIRGGYTVSPTASTNQLTIQLAAANYFDDPTTGSNNDLSAAAFALADITLPTITILVPEPMTGGLVGLASLGMLGGLRRRRA